MLNARLKVYSPDGGVKSVLAYPVSWNASFPWNDVSALRLDYPQAVADSGLLGGPVEVAVEVADGESGWIEPPNGRYRLLERSADAAQRQADVVSYTLPGYAGVMDGVAIVPAKFSDAKLYDEDGKRKFLSATPGQILTAVLSDARALVDNLTPGLELGFTPTTDSNGQPWARKVTIYYEPGLSMLTVLSNLAEQGQCDWWMDGRTLKVVNPDSTARETGEILRGSPSEVPVRSSLAGLLHTGFLVGEEGAAWRVDNKDTVTPWGASMRVLTQGGVSDEQTALGLIQSELEAGRRERVEYTWAANAATVDVVPFTAYVVGDWVEAFLDGSVPVRVRVHQVTLSYGDDGLNVNLTLNDRFVDAQVRNAKRMRGIVNGASGDAGTSTVPSRADAAKAVPAKPEGVVAESSGYWDADTARSLVRVSFGPVILDVQGRGIDLDHYEVSVAGYTVRTSKNTGVVVDGLVPGHTVPVFVTAVSRHGVRSETAVVNVSTVQPDAVLDPPTVLDVSSNTGIVTVYWDGDLQASGGEPYSPPAHFAHVRVEESRQGGAWTPVGVTLGGFTLDRQDAVGESFAYRAVAVDRLGHESAPSPVASVTVENEARALVDGLGERLDDQTRLIQDAHDAAVAAQEAASNAMQAALTDNLAINGDFSFGDLTNWSSSGALVDVTGPNGEAWKAWEWAGSSHPAYGDVWYDLQPGDYILTDLWVHLDKDGSTFFIEMRDTGGVHAPQLSRSVGDTSDPIGAFLAGDGTSEGVYILSAEPVVTGWNHFQVVTEIKASTPSRLFKWYFNHPNSADRTATYQVSQLKIYKITDAVIARKATLEAQARADEAYGLAEGKADASELATVKASADGKNTITVSTVQWSTTTPGVVAGDLWRWVDADGDLYGTATWDGTQWQPSLITSEAIDHVDVHKLTATGTSRLNDVVATTIAASDIIKAGIVESDIFRTRGKFVGTNVEISNTGVAVTGSSQAGVWLDSTGLIARRADGTQTVRIGTNGTAEFSGTVSASTITGSTMVGGTFYSGNYPGYPHVMINDRLPISTRAGEEQRSGIQFISADALAMQPNIATNGYRQGNWSAGALFLRSGALDFSSDAWTEFTLGRALTTWRLNKGNTAASAITIDSNLLHIAADTKLMFASPSPIATTSSAIPSSTASMPGVGAYWNGTELRLYRMATSRRELKTHIAPFAEVDRILDLEPRVYHDKAQWERYEQDGGDEPRLNIGLIVDEVQAAGLDELILYDENGAGGIAYDRLAVALLPTIKQIATYLDKEHPEWRK